MTYVVINGQAIFEGDIVLEHVDEQLGAQPVPSGIGVAYRASLWPKVGGVFQVPYTVVHGSTNMTNAIIQFNSTFSGFIQWVPHNMETDFVSIDLTATDHSGVCNSIVGRAGHSQPLGGSVDCSVGTLLHEMGHTIGLWHEQSRADRNTYVTVNYNNVIKGSRSNFDQLMDNAQNLTLYDYASIMHYVPFAFSRNGGPTIESIPTGIPLSNTVAYTAADLDGIQRLYGTPPTQVTVASNPSGLKVVVDGVTVVTPQQFPWALNSTHTLDIPAGSQTLSGITYTYGRWNDNAAAMHTLTVLPGNKLVPEPASSPAVTVYTANFIQLVSYVSSISPPATGSVTPSPAPQSFPPASGVFFAARQPVTLTATPSSGQSFYAFFNSPSWLPGGLSANPKTFFAPDTGLQISVEADFTNTPVTTVTVNPTASNLGVRVDSVFWYAPKNFAPQYDLSWNAGSTHSVSVDTPQQPYSFNSRYAFSSWSDGGALTHNITAPSANTTFTASITPQFFPVEFANQSCAGSIVVSPGSPSGDGFYPGGSNITFTQTTNTGWIFTGWQFDLTGTVNPQNLTVNDEELVVADYNTVAAPLSIANLSPAAAVTGTGNFTLTIKGTGFTSKTQLFINNTFHAATLVNATTLTATVTALDIATPGAIQIFLQNSPTGAVCRAIAAKPFFVAASPLLAPSPASITFPSQVVGTTSSQIPVTLKNVSTSAVTISSVVASGSFAQTNACGTLSPGQTCIVNVTLTPNIAGRITGAVTVTDTALDSPQIIQLVGTGIAPLSQSPASLSFGTVTVGNTSPQKTVTLTNNTASSLSFSFAASANYAAIAGGVTPCGSSLASKAKCTMLVSFTPTANGNINGAVTVGYTGVFSPQEITLSGSGTGGATAPLKFLPTSISFAGTPVGATSAATIVAVTNSSATSLSISSIAASGNFNAMASGVTPCGGALAAAAKCTFTVTFSPSISGTIKGAVAIVDTAPVSTQVLNVQGTAVLPVSFSPGSLSFAAQTVGTNSVSQSVTLTNNTSASLNLTSIVASGDFAVAPGGAKPCGASVAAKGTCTFTVGFAPTALGTVNGVVTVTYGPGNQQMLTVAGTGQ